MTEINLMLPWFPRRTQELSESELTFYLALLGPDTDHAEHIARHMCARFKIEERQSSTLSRPHQRMTKGK